MRELIVDSFAGGGGASLGIAWATGRHPDVAINHEPAAIAMHAANHPKTKHYTEDVFEVSPRAVTRGRPAGLLWSSPDCKHFSRAKGSKPVNKNIRGLAWVVVKWATQVAPRVIILENVREFQDWGPLVPAWKCGGCGWTGTEGQAKLLRRRRACPRCDSVKLAETDEKLPDPSRKGLTFKQFVGRLKARGYEVAWKVLNAADFGAPTHRRRLFLVARNDGEPIVWPDPTHGDPKAIGTDLFFTDLKPWRTAVECIDWSIPCPSIFERKKPLTEKTLRRIAAGIKRYVIDKARPYLVDMQRVNRPRGTDEPVGTVTTQGNKFNLVTPIVTPVTHAGERRSHEMGEPLPTVTGANRGELAVVCPIITPVRSHGGGGNDAAPAEQPLRSVTCTKRGEFAVVAPVVARIGQTGGNGGYANDPAEPLTTVTSKAEHILVAPVLTNLGHGDGLDGRDRGLRANMPDQPLGTVHAGGGSFAVIAPTLMRHFGKSADGASVEAPVVTITAGGMGKQVLIAPTLVQTGYGEAPGQAPRALDIEAPLGTAVAGGQKYALCAAFLAKHYGGVVGHSPDRPLGTVTAVDHHSIVAANMVHLNHGDKTASGADEPARTVTASGTHAALVYSFLTKYYRNAVGQELGEPLHTLTTADRFGLVTVTIDGQPYAIVDIGMRMLRPRELARAQGFPDSYTLTGSATSQVKRIGNSVPPHLAQAVAAVNFTPRRVRKAVA